MSPLAPLALCWLAAPVFLVVDGRKVAFGSLAVGILATVAVVDIVLLTQMAWLDRKPFTTVTGNWPVGLGIRLHVDGVSLFFGAVCATVLAATMLHEAVARVRSASFPALLLFMCAGLHGAFFTGDLFNFYVFFEVSVVASFALAAYGYGRQEVRGAFVYIVANLLGSVLFLIGCAVVYHTAGTLDLVELANREAHTGRGIHPLGAVLLFAALSLKLGLFPLHGWVPVLYHHSQPAVAAVMSGALINIGGYGLLRIGMGAAQGARSDGELLLLGLGAIAIIYGALLSSRRETAAEIVAYASIAQAGYIVVALGVGGHVGASAALLVVLAGSIEKAAMFLSHDSRGAGRAASALVGACGIAGLPVTLGFLAKIELFRASLAAPFGVVLIIAIVVGTLFLLVAAVRFWSKVRQTPPPDGANAPAAGVLAGASVALTLAAAPLGAMIITLSRELLNGGHG